MFSDTICKSKQFYLLFGYIRKIKNIFKCLENGLRINQKRSTNKCFYFFISKQWVHFFTYKWYLKRIKLRLNICGAYTMIEIQLTAQIPFCKRRQLIPQKMRRLASFAAFKNAAFTQRLLYICMRLENGHCQFVLF